MLKVHKKKPVDKGRQEECASTRYQSDNHQVTDGWEVTEDEPSHSCSVLDHTLVSLVTHQS